MNGNHNTKRTVVTRKMAEQIRLEALEVYAETGKTPRQIAEENQQMRRQLILKSSK